MKKIISLSLLTVALGALAADPEPAPPPKGALVLFDGKSTDALQMQDGKPCQWLIQDGYMQVRSGNAVSKEKFQDFQLHVEFWLPKLPDDVKSQARANSGVYLQGRYEIQVLDSYHNSTYAKGGCGAIYGQKDPDNFDQAVKPPENWNTYDITYRAPRFDADVKMTEKPRVTALWNGVKIHDNVEINGGTAGNIGGEAAKPGPILLQDHGNPVRYRNVWIVPAKVE